MDIPTTPPCLDAELQPSTGRGERVGCSSGVCVPCSYSLPSSCCVIWEAGDWGLEHSLGTLTAPQSWGVLWNWTGMGMERSLPLAPSLPQPTWGFFKGLVKVKELIPMDFKLFSIF